MEVDIDDEEKDSDTRSSGNKLRENACPPADDPDEREPLDDEGRELISTDDTETSSGMCRAPPMDCGESVALAASEAEKEEEDEEEEVEEKVEEEELQDDVVIEKEEVEIKGDRGVPP